MASLETNFETPDLSHQNVLANSDLPLVRPLYSPFIRHLDPEDREVFNDEPPLESACMEAEDGKELLGSYDYVIIATRGVIASEAIKAAHKLGKKVIVLCEKEDLSYPGNLIDTQGGDVVFRIPTHRNEKNRGMERTDVQMMKAMRENLKQMGIDSERTAVCTGYGDKAEDSDWHKCMHEIGIQTIGPSAEWIALLGDKASANKLANTTELQPPSSSGVIEVVEQALDFFRAQKKNISMKTILRDLNNLSNSENSKFILKDCHGGGGSGQVEISEDVSEEDFITAVQTFIAQGRKFTIDQFIKCNKHIEMQVMMDREGNIRFGTPRDCTQQRDKQKVIEETADFADMPPEQIQFLRDNITKMLFAGAEKLGHPYEGLLTCEFLYDPRECEFYFLEGNTRIQVEHAVSGHQGGIDYVQTQIDIADRKTLKSQELLDLQAEIRGGHTIEARICFERPVTKEEQQDIKEAFGVKVSTRTESGKPIDRLELPVGKGITVYMDNRIQEGGKMPKKDYDSLVMQVVARGEDRYEAHGRLVKAVESLQVEGVHTNKELVLGILNHPKFHVGVANSSMKIADGVMQEMQKKYEAGGGAKGEEQKIASIIGSVAKGEISAPEAFENLDFRQVFRLYLSDLKPTRSEIEDLLEAFGITSRDISNRLTKNELSVSENQLSSDLEDVFDAFGVERKCPNTIVDVLLVPQKIEPIFIAFLKVYGGVR